VEKLGIEKNVRLLPMLPQSELWKEYARSTISVSISEHDGTPNTLLEAMALGCLPVCGDIESIREWIKPGVNGELVPPGDAEALAASINQILAAPGKFKGYATANQKLVSERADKLKIRTALDDFYQHLVIK
jgi:glycosyltransferase involved in cell wall biosynthesis